jgi:hypothetical protein
MDPKPTVHPLSRATTYIETYAIRLDDGRHEMRSYATGFFVRAADTVLLVTNWHVVSGLDPSNPSASKLGIVPHYMKVSVRSVDGMLTELSLPLYSRSMEPLWDEHPDGAEVDVIVYSLPTTMEKYFHLVDIVGAADRNPIDASIAKDVFILGYPFARPQLREGFGDRAAYHLPIWKRGSIASEPAVRFNDRVILIDALSRAGMSGAPVVVAEDEKGVSPTSPANQEIFRRWQRGDQRALLELNTAELSEYTKKRFNLLGVYSGVIGSTKLQEVALGKCWHVDVLVELVGKHVPGRMPFHAPPHPHEFYQAHFAEVMGGLMIRKDAEGTVIDRVSIR